ncbi:MAG: hypothetical protein V1494_02495 [Candidatus Diapherotrites archaeon]
MNKKGQSAFEVAFLLGVLLILVMVSAGRYLSIQDQNTAMVYTKLKALENLEAENSFYYLKSIDVAEDSGALKLSINTQPATKPNGSPLGFSSPSLDEIAKEIKCRTDYSTVIVSLNGTETATYNGAC